MTAYKLSNNITRLFWLILLYFLLKYFIPYGYYAVYPINLLVTFLHELGHGLWAIFTGWSVDSVQINTDGSGHAVTAGGLRTIVLLGGYVWSAILGNILLYIAFKKQKYSETTLYILAAIILFTAIFWFSSLISSALLIIGAAAIIFIAKKTIYDSLVLWFFAIASLLYIIEDFNVGPSSDLTKFSEIFIFIPTSVWMWSWLMLVLLITWANIWLIHKK